MGVNPPNQKKKSYKKPHVGFNPMNLLCKSFKSNKPLGLSTELIYFYNKKTKVVKS
jgi:hypothetical protein